jgi:hypothetical protein
MPPIHVLMPDAEDWRSMVIFANYLLRLVDQRVQARA